MTDRQTLTTSTAPRAPSRQGSGYLGTFGALLGRDLTVLRTHFGEFAGQTAMQPLLLVWVFTYLLPETGINPGGPGFGVATVLLPGLLASTALITGISVEKIFFGAWQALRSGLLVFPLAYFKGMRAGLTPSVTHMAPAAFLTVIVAMLALLLVISIRLFIRRLQT